MEKMRICVIGAGVSGLPAIKACLEQGLDVQCFEKTAQIGGLWNYRPTEANIGANVMASTVVNTSKEMMAYSDFPPPSDWPNFMHHSLVQKYLEMYAAHFHLLTHIQFNVEVTKVQRNGDKSGSAKWLVSLSNGTQMEFAGVMICTGHHWRPNVPKLPGLHKFKGRLMHAKEYRDYRGFEGKRVFLLGIGNSALDIAIELANIAKRVVLSTRRGTWIFNRIGQWGLPYDVIYQTRFYNWLMAMLPWSIANDFHEWRIQRKMDHDLYGLRPKHRFFQQHPAVNDSLANLLACGKITITEDISSLEEDDIVVGDGRRFEADVLVLCTGYTFGFPFLEPQGLVPVTEDNQVELYKYVFPPSAMAQGLALIGLIQPIGSVAPISEMQSRWAAAVFAGRLTLPPEIEMRQEIAKKRAQMQRQYFQSAKHTVQVQFIPYMDELAELVGCKPDIRMLFRQNLRLAMRLFLGPNVPYMYRLCGPDKWEGAERAIAGVPERVKMPLKQCGLAGNADPIVCRQKRGLLDGHFTYATTKCLALYLTVVFAIVLWLFVSSDDFPMLTFIWYTLALSAIAFMAYLFNYDVVWL